MQEFDEVRNELALLRDRRLPHPLDEGELDLAAGEAEAGQRLQALRQQLERDAAGGDEQAGRLLLQWR